MEEKPNSSKDESSKEKVINEVEKKSKLDTSSSELSTFFASNKFYILCSLFVGAIIMYVVMLLTNTATSNVQNVINEDIKTTTLEETSDLKVAINNVYESTVYIEVSKDKSAISAGSGFVYKKDSKYGYILTNYHVIESGNKYKITYTDGSEVEATLVNGDEYYDIAVLKVDVNSIKKVATMGNSSNAELGDTVFTVGAPLSKDYMGTITKGIISGVNRMVTVSLSSGSYLTEVLQTDASINSGNSGGPICNIKGEVIGITSSKLIGSGVESMGFAIPINSVMDVISSVESGTKIARPYLGVQLVDLTNTFALQYYYGITIGNDVEFGAVLSYVEDGKPASNAGLKVGDIVVEINGEKVEDVSHFKYILYKYSVGDKVNMKYYRDNKLSEITVTLSEAIQN